MVEGVYSRKWYMGKGEGFRIYKRTSGWIRGKDKCRNKKVRGNKTKKEEKTKF